MNESTAREVVYQATDQELIYLLLKGLKIILEGGPLNEKVYILTLQEVAARLGVELSDEEI